MRRSAAPRGPVSLAGPGEPGLVSVIMPCHDAATFLAEAVRSVLGQGYRRVELIAVDDGSRDATVEILHNFAEGHHERMRVLQRATRDPAQARNLALRHAQGQYIAFLDAEDWWHPRFLERMVRALRGSKRQLAYCGWHDVDARRGIGEHYLPPDYGPADFINTAIDDSPWPVHATLSRRGLIAALGGFSEQDPQAMDDDLWLRASALSPGLVRVPEFLVFRREREPGKGTAPPVAHVLSAWRARRRFADSCPARLRPASKRALQARCDAYLLRQADRALEANDLATARRLFRTALAHRVFSPGDLSAMLVALLPDCLYAGLARTAGARRFR